MTETVPLMRVAQAAWGRAERFYNFMTEDTRRLRSAAMLTLILGIGASIERSSDSTALPFHKLAAQKTLDVEAGPRRLAFKVPANHKKRSTPITTSPPITTTTTQPKLSYETEVYNLMQKDKEVVPMGSRAKIAIDAMQLTIEGYRNFISSIDNSYLGFSQLFTEFNPHKVPIDQGRPTQMEILHYTTFYRNNDGPSLLPIGRMLVQPFIQGMARRGEVGDHPKHQCCGINGVIDRDGNFHQLAPFTAKLRHALGFDAISTGIEIESTGQENITTPQYIAAAYYTIADWRADAGLTDKPYSEVVRGHGEVTDAYRLLHPGALEFRNDFDFPVTEYFREKVQVFIDSNFQEIASTQFNLD